MKPGEEITMDNLTKLSELVYDILVKNEKARNSDTYLYYIVCNEKLRSNGHDISKITLADSLLRREELGLPPFESVRRTRQKIQHDNQELAGSKAVEAFRSKNEKEYREYARS